MIFRYYKNTFAPKAWAHSEIPETKCPDEFKGDNMFF